MTAIRYDYARRCRRASGSETYARVHAVEDMRLLCGPEVDEGWWYEPCLFEGDWDPDRVTCPKCRRELRRREGRR